MNITHRWIAISFALGICAAYALWGNPGPHTGSGVPPSPVSTFQNSISALKLEPPTIDFGEVYVGENHPATVQVINPSRKVVHITSIKRSCGCLSSGMATQELAPGKNQPLALTLTGLAGVKTQSQTLTLVTDEPGSPSIQLPVHYKVVEVFKLEPVVLYFGKVPRNTSKTLEVKLTRNDGKGFKIKEISTPQSEFTFKVKPINEQENAYSIEVTAQGHAPQLIEGSAGILTDHPRMPGVSLALSLEVGGDVIPSKLILSGELGSDGTVTGMDTKLKRVTPGKLAIEKVTDGTGRAIDFVVEPIDDGNCHLLLHFTKEDLQRAAFGEILITTNAEVEPLKLGYSVKQIK